MDIKEKIKGMPSSAGVYLMKDAKGSVIYVGKAGNLKVRVSSYFRSSARHSERLTSLVLQVRDIDYIPSSTEAEALIYENSLIKEYSPKYNVALKDDKSYPLLKLTINEKFPRLIITRQRKDDGAAYYGPYTNVKLLRGALAILKILFPLRTCNRMSNALCLNYHIKQCAGPCAGRIVEAGYRDIVSELKLFLEGKREELRKFVSEKMVQAAAREDYEEAARLRDTLESLSAIKEDRINYSPRNDVAELKESLSIHGELDVIEAFDVSNIMGEAAVGSMVSFYKGRPKKGEYKRFRIKAVSKINDYDMMRELINRRYSRLIMEKKKMPDLIVIDGGRGHLNAALDELKRLRLSGIFAIGIAKEFEHVYLEGKKEPLVLAKESKALHLLRRIRDEAHRFAIAYHKHLRSKKIEFSELDNIEGIGVKRKRGLLNHFGSVENTKAASFEELLKVKGMNEKSARNIIGYFKK